MAGIGPLGPINQLEQVSRDLSENSPEIRPLFGEIEQFLALIGESSGAAYETGVGGVVIEASEGAGVALTDTVGFLLVAGVLLILLTIRLLEGVILYLIGHIPWFGSRLVGPVKGVFSWVDHAENAAVAFLVEQVRHVLHNLITMVAWCLGQLGIHVPAAEPAPRSAPHDTVTQAQLAHVQHEINQLRVAHDITNYVINNKTVTVGVPQNLWDQIHVLMQSISVLRNDMSALRTLVERSLSDSAQNKQELERLSQGLHDMRAVSVGWSNVQETLNRTDADLKRLITSTSTQLSQVTRTQARMMPLSLLLQPGLPGLRNLRKLEDNICQCPKLFNMPDEVAMALILDQGILNGF